MNQGDFSGPDDAMSEGFHSASLGGGDTAPTAAAAAATTSPTGATSPGKTGTDAPTVIATNPARLDLPELDMTTPQGLATARDILQRAVEITTRHTHSARQEWISAGAGAPRPATAPPLATRASGDPTLPGSAATRVGGVPADGFPVVTTGLGVPSFGVGVSTVPAASTGNVVPSFAFGVPSVPSGEQQAVPWTQPAVVSWTHSSVPGGVLPAAAFGPTPRLRTTIAS
jgi:hypothetical protein